jgi:NMD protein affecting ribosome stability and mRNA decay
LSGDKETKTGKNSNSGHCPHCGKRHRGECRFKPSGTKDTSSSTNNNNQYKFNKLQRQYINQLVEAVVKKTKHDSNVVESDEDEDWSKSMTPSEYIYVLSAAQTEQHTDEMGIEIDVDDLKDFKRRFKAVRKKIKKQLYSK